MAPKKGAVDLTSPESVALISRFQKTGLTESRARNIVQSTKSSSAYSRLVEEAGLDKEDAGLDEKQAGLCADLSTAGGYEAGEGKQKLTKEQVLYVVGAIKDGRLKSSDQISAAVSYLESTHGSGSIDKEAFDKACGVGISFTPESIAESLSSYFSSLSVSAPEGVSVPTDWSGLKTFRESLKTGLPDMRWANGKDLTVAVDNLFTSVFGTRAAATAAAKAKPAAKAPAKKAISENVSSNPAEASNPTSLFTDGFLSRLHAPGENPQINEENMKKHLEATGKRVMTRFPPEPNGYLHIGHAKAITIDFGYAKHNNGCCYLRFDDTNPDAEEGVYFDSILEMVRWLGFEPWKITYSSDNFQKLYDFAMELTKRGKAFVCYCDQEAMAAAKGGGRGSPTACPHRDRPVDENVRDFERMKNGEFPEKGACLRMKIDLTSGNPYLWDPVCYRIKSAPHHRTGDKWKIYPAYDFAHPLCDSIENITHSLCTLEFIDARASYEWLCDALEVYKPRQYETARLQLTGTFLSKRKIKALVENGHVRGWDDPRLFTLIALRRRGIPPAAMLKFVEELGVSLSNSEIRLARFEQAIRQTLELMVPRLFVVLSPVKLIIENVEEDWTYAVEKPLHPKIPEMGKSKLTMTKTLIIDRDDFRITPPAEFSRLSPGKSVMLMGGPHPVTCTGYETDASGDVTEIRCALENGTGPNGDRKFKAKDTVAIHWLSNAPEGKIELDEVRFFEPLFKSENPAKLENYEDDINPDSLKVYKGAYIEPTFFGLAKNLIKQAKEEADKRTKAAASFSAAGNVDAKAQSSVEMGTNSTATDVPHGSDPDTPVATAAQLVGMECIRFQGMRLAYFAVDKESVLGCLNEGDGVEAGQRSGDKLILNKIVSLKEEKGKAA